MIKRPKLMLTSLRSDQESFERNRNQILYLIFIVGRTTKFIEVVIK